MTKKHAFKPGDKVRCIDNDGYENGVVQGSIYEVVGVWRAGVSITDARGNTRNMFATRFEPVTEPKTDQPDFSGPYRTLKVVKTWIIAVLDKDGKPQPNTAPAVYSSEKQAETVAKEMAKKHPGETFMVFQGTHVAAQPKVVEVELVRL